MNIDFVDGDLTRIQRRCLALFALADGSPVAGGEAAAELVKPFVESGEFGKGLGDEIYLINPKGFLAERILIVNVGKELDKTDTLRRAAGKAWQGLRKRSVTEVCIPADSADEGQTRALLEGFALADYQYDALKSERDDLPARLKTLTLANAGDREKAKRWLAICEGSCRARDLCQMPANILTPVKFGELAVQWGREHGFETRVMGHAEIQETGMGALLSVAQGSAHEPRFIMMEYKPKQAFGTTMAFVGKAVTFDSGGLSLKPSAAMPEMKGDMGGGAAVLGLMTVLRDIGCRHRVVGLVPAVENMPSGTATRPSDVVASLSGLTVEINNTDAEGRLILADALTYAERYKPDYVIDFATLTGACLVALGPKVFGVMGNCKPLVDAIVQAGEDVHEPFWELPLVEEYKEYLDSDVADISNISNVRWGGTITAGLFLQRFADDFQWAHCDIAASIFEKSDDYSPSGGTGVGVRMAVRMMELLKG